jgi:hypothetical protein
LTNFSLNSTIGGIYRLISDLNDLDTPEDFNDQLEIINALKHIDRRISINNSINYELKQMGKELFNYSFFNSQNTFINE